MVKKVFSKRLLSLAFALMTVMSLLPLSAFSASAAETIDSFNISLSTSKFPVPFLGETPNRDVEVLASSVENAVGNEGKFICDKYNSNWAEIKGGTPYYFARFDSTDVTFADGKQYYLSLALEKAEDYEFDKANLSSYKLNGKSAEYITVFDGGIRIYFPYGEPTENLPDEIISDFNITLDKNSFPYPATGESVARNTDVLTTAVNNAQGNSGKFSVDVGRTYWTEMRSGSMYFAGDLNDTDEVFSGNKQYYLMLNIKPNDGYVFSEAYQDNYKLNGVAPYRITFQSWGIAADYIFGDITADEQGRTQISEMAVNVTHPVGGEHPDFTATSGSDGYTAKVSYWHGPNKDLTETDTFKVGITYSVEVEISPDKDYVFLDRMDVTINGKKAVHTDTNKETGTRTYAVNLVAEDTTVSKITVEGLTTPTAGGQVSLDFTLSDNCTAEEFYWFEADRAIFGGDDLMELYFEGEYTEETFKSGKYYTFMVVVKPTEGKTFADDITATVNGQNAYFDETFGAVCIYYYIPESTGLLGDANEDGVVNVKDATLIQKHVASIVNLSGSALALSDVNSDTAVNVKDATAIQKFVASIDTGYSIGQPVS